MREKITKKEFLNLDSERKCRVLVDIILGKLEIWDENENGDICK